MQAWAPLVPGTLFAGDYRVVAALKHGGMGAVYVVDQLSTGKQRALKTMHPQLVEDAKSRARFTEEARVGARIESEHVVEVVAAGVDEPTGIPWLAMELLEGDDLEAVMKKRGALPARAVAEILSQLAHALSDAHAKGIVHSDLKPENIFLARTRRRGADFIVKILDFGIARTAERSRTAATVTTAIGSPLWMAPEQATPGAKVRPSTDVWALGLIAFYGLTGRSYWRSASAEEFNLTALFSEIVALPLERASLRARELGARDVPPGFDAWFAGCVERDPLRRFPEAGAAISALTPILTASSTAPSSPSTGPVAGEAVHPTLAMSPMGPTAPLPSASSSPGYGPSSSPGAFGASSSPGYGAQSSSPGYGAPGYGAPASPLGAFGASSPPGYGAPASPPGAFGASSLPGYGAQPSSSPGAFGSPGYGVPPSSAPGAFGPAGGYGTHAPQRRARSWWPWIAIGVAVWAVVALAFLLVPPLFLARQSSEQQQAIEVAREREDAARRDAEARAAQEAEAARRAAEAAREAAQAQEQAALAREQAAQAAREAGAIATAERMGATRAVVRTGSPDVRGMLSREVIRRVVQRHLGEVRSCYERGLASRPGLEGRVSVSFIIAPTGSVTSSSIASSTLNDAGVESCITTAARRWVFPSPDGGGIVGVNYPFVLHAETPSRVRGGASDDDPLSGLDGL